MQKMGTKKIKISKISKLEDNQPTHAFVKNTDLVIPKHANGISVLYGRCRHRGALMSNGYEEGHNLICRVHG
jgi:nitrite reductase/ring-hydroxylating ferredoxin subunit